MSSTLDGRMGNHTDREADHLPTRGQVCHQNCYDPNKHGLLGAAMLGGLEQGH